MASTSKAVHVVDDSDFPTDWDIDQYRAEYDSEEHWLLRRKFMETHKDKFPEERLVCLAQVFFNVEFLGCKYPQETMRLVAELSKDVAKDFRDSRSNRLKRKFVGASEAAEQRAKGRRNAQQQRQEYQSDGPSTSRNCGRGSTSFTRERAHFQSNDTSSNFRDRNRQYDQNQESARRKHSDDLFSGLPYGKFVLQLVGGRNCISVSAQRCKMDYEERAISHKAIAIYLNNRRLAESDDLNMKASKANAFQKALNILQRNCYTIKLNPLQDTIKIDKKNKKIVCDVVREPVDDVTGQKLDATNKGYKMMKMMGWTGGGLGSTMQGREDPVSYLFKNNRSGLGNSTDLDKQYFREVLQNYVNSDDIRQLQFEATFTKDERATLHELAASLNLKSVARGTGETRFLTIHKKNISEETILNEVLINKNPRFCNKYFVQVPESKKDLYPDHVHHLELD